MRPISLTQCLTKLKNIVSARLSLELLEDPAARNVRAPESGSARLSSDGHEFYFHYDEGGWLDPEIAIAIAVLFDPDATAVTTYSGTAVDTICQRVKGQWCVTN